MKKISILFLLSIIISSCASRPRPYPNQTYKAKGKEAVEKDIDACMAEADNYVKGSRGRKVASSAGQGAGVGAAVGGAFGLLTGGFRSLLGGAVGGAVIGGAGGAAAGALSPDEIKHNYVNKCLAEKGIEVIGWD